MKLAIPIAIGWDFAFLLGKEKNHQRTAERYLRFGRQTPICTFTVQNSVVVRHKKRHCKL